MLTLTYGSKQPETNDRGPVVFPALEDNIAQFDAHTHDGVTSPKILTKSFTKTTQSIASGSWVLVANGHYSQTVTLTGGLNYDDVTLSFKLSTGEVVYPSVSKASATTATIAFDDNTQTLTMYIN